MIFEDKCARYKFITLNKREVCDFELLVNGGFNPLNGFMNKIDYRSCVENMRLYNGHLWSMPITLSINEKQRDELKHCDYVVLKHETGLPLGLMNISSSDSIYEYDLKKETHPRRRYGSTRRRGLTFSCPILVTIPGDDSKN